MCVLLWICTSSYNLGLLSGLTETQPPHVLQLIILQLQSHRNCNNANTSLFICLPSSLSAKAKCSLCYVIAFLECSFVYPDREVLVLYWQVVLFQMNVLLILSLLVSIALATHIKSQSLTRQLSIKVIIMHVVNINSVIMHVAMYCLYALYIQWSFERSWMRAKWGKVISLRHLSPSSLPGPNLHSDVAWSQWVCT